mmetsp:Transcript_30816/g.100346  ORF Transcript_30816/g.100346 Transcript_30816/m.100346 type:complete len:310 (+) Transcript_30816:865-1794(+)
MLASTKASFHSARWVGRGRQRQKPLRCAVVSAAVAQEPFSIIDAFTPKAYGGNPAAVVLLSGGAEWPTDERLLLVAREFNLSETAFLRPRVASASEYDLRWFTPAVEVDLCGHATLASAHFVYERQLVSEHANLTFHTRSGQLGAARQDALIELEFPQSAPAPVSADESARAAEALQLSNEPEYVGRNSVGDLLVLLPSEAAVRGLAPEMARLATLGGRGVIVTAAGDEAEVDFTSRFFAPCVGIAEDPVTGSAHCALGPFWGERLGKSVLSAVQVSERIGILEVELLADARIAIRGSAVEVFRGEICC